MDQNNQNLNILNWDDIAQMAAQMAIGEQPAANQQPADAPLTAEQLAERFAMVEAEKKVKRDEEKIEQRAARQAMLNNAGPVGMLNF